MTYRQLPDTLYTDIHPTPVAQPEILVWNDALANELGLDPSVWKNSELLGGNRLPEDFTPIAQAYFGHQFGHLTNLGDGRAILLAEVVSPDGGRFDIQLKGSGPTPYSRRGDGRAALAPMLREYLVSEAMHALGIATSRSLAVITTGEPVVRERNLPGAILVRVAASHLRVGTMQYAQAKGVHREVADYALNRHYPSCAMHTNPYLCLLEEISNRQADLIAQWMSVGFIHGVMNTDNMTLSGETIDYGPCAFMDHYRADQVFSSIDQSGRYRYLNQPAIAQWNLTRLAETMLDLIDPDVEIATAQAEALLGRFRDRYRSAWLSRMAQKFGLRHPIDTDQAWILQFLTLLEAEGLDFTNTFRSLTDHPEVSPFASDGGRAWHRAWRDRTAEVDIETLRHAMRRANPRVIPRNDILQAALNAAEAGNMTPYWEMLRVVQQPWIDPPIVYMAPRTSDQPFVTFCGT